MLKFRHLLPTFIFCSILFTTCACAQSTLTEIRDTVTNVDGTPFNGTVVITWNGYINSTGGAISPLSTSARIYTGALSVLLVPSTTASAGTYYQAVYNSNDGTVTWTETWQVPPSATPLVLSQVRQSNNQGSGSGGSGSSGGSGGSGTSGGAQYATLPIPISAITGLASDLGTINASLTTLTSSLNTLTGLVNSGSSLAGLTTTVTNLSSTVTALNSTVTGMTSTVNALGSTLTGLSDTVGSTSSALSSLTGTVNTLSSTVSGNGTTLSGLTTAVNGLSSTVTANGNSLTSLNTTVNGLSSTVTGNSTSLTSLASSVKALSATVNGNGSTISGLTSSLSTLNSTVTAISSTVAGLVNTVNSLSAGGTNVAFVDAETPSGTMDGTNASFTLASAPAPTGSLELYRNGVMQTAGIDFTLSGAAVTFASDSIPKAADILQAYFRIPGTGQTSTFADNETPGGTIDGANLTFTLAAAPNPSLSLRLYKNGMLLQQNGDYTLNGLTISFSSAAVTPQPGDSILASYRH